MLLVGMVIFVLLAVLLQKGDKEAEEEESFNEIRLDWLQRPSGPWT